MSTGIGDNQRGVMRSLSGEFRSGRRSPYPSGGWVWDNDSTTQRICDSLVNRGYVRKVGSKYHLTAAGARELGIAPTQDELQAECEDEDAAARARRIEQAEARGAAAANADAQACKTAAGGVALWRSREHTVPPDPDERLGWMRGYGKVFAYWGGEKL